MHGTPEADPQVVLLVEDHDDSREALTATFEAYGFNVRSAHDGAAAVAALQAGLRPCAIILDARMPMMDGFAVWRWIQNRTDLASTPVIFLTGAEHDADQAVALGVPHLLKPADPEELAAILSAHCQPQRRPAALPGAP